MPHKVAIAVILALILSCSGLAVAQDSTGLEQYLAAVKQSDTSRQIAGLEQYLGSNPSGSLRNDALAIVAWDYARSFDRTRAADKARQLLAKDNNNPVALAVLYDAEAAPAAAPNVRLKDLQAAMAAQWRKPEGMREI